MLPLTLSTALSKTIMLLAFGPSETYFFDDGKGNRKWRVSPAFDRHMATHPAISINALALGQDGAFFINRCSNDILKTYNNDWLDDGNHYPEFKAWLFDNSLGHDRSKVTVCLGDNGQFWATSNAGYRFVGAPESLLAYFQKFTSNTLWATRRVNSVDHGYDGTFLGICVDNSWFWNLGDHYPELSKMIKTKDVHKLAQTQLVSSSTTATQPQYFANQNYNTLAQAYNPPTYPWSQPSQSSPGWGQQSLDVAQNILQAYNNAQGQSGGNDGGGGNIVNGIQMVNDMTNNGLMVGQMIDQLGGVGAIAGAACVMM
ncbi:hypothetical protein MBLNU459_g7626t1 [Dothideomycetes sp. NU459]